jgi:hypothetical protein
MGTDVRTKRAGSFLHHLLDGGVRVIPEVIQSCPTEDDTLVVHDHTLIPSRLADLFPHIPHAALESAGGNLPPS